MDAEIFLLHFCRIPWKTFHADHGSEAAEERSQGPHVSERHETLFEQIFTGHFIRSTLLEPAWTPYLSEPP